MKMPQDRYIKVGHINTRYWAEGSQGSPVILIHGIGGYVEGWLPNIDVLATQHQVYAVDLLGHGRTEKPLDVSYTIASLTQFVKDFMTALGIEQASCRRTFSRRGNCHTAGPHISKGSR